MPVWSQYLQNIANSLNVSVTQAGIISSLIISIGILVVMVIATRGKGALVTIPVTMFFLIVFFLYIGWFPIWTGSIIALVLVLFLAWIISQYPTGVT